jgi:hypothetical protein
VLCGKSVAVDNDFQVFHQLLYICRVGTRLNELNVPLKRNQSLIVQMVMTYRKQIVDVALIDELCDPELIKKRSELLRSPEVSEPLLSARFVFQDK